MNKLYYIKVKPRRGNLIAFVIGENSEEAIKLFRKITKYKCKIREMYSLCNTPDEKGLSQFTKITKT